MVGCDPGTSSLDLLLLVDGGVAEQVRLTPDELRAEPARLLAVLNEWSPIDLIAGPSGYGLPLVRGEEFQETHLELMSLVRPDERDQRVGVAGFRSWVKRLVSSGLPVVFLPGGIHLPSIPPHRKVNAIDMGTADKVAVAALALWADRQTHGGTYTDSTFAVVELGSVFAAILVISKGQLVDASAGTRGPIGYRSSGLWDGETAYWRSPLGKNNLYRGGLLDLGPLGPDAFFESLTKHVAGLRAITPFDRIFLSGSAAAQSAVGALAYDALVPFGEVISLPTLRGSWVKHAAQGAALLADGLADGTHSDLVGTLRLRESGGTVLDYLGSE